MKENGDEVPQSQPVSRLSELAEADPRPEPPATAAFPSGTPGEPATAGESVDALAAARKQFARLLGEFRRTAVLVPFDEQDSLWTADFNGVRWICAFSDEDALARFAAARGESEREWTYRTVLGARLLDVMVPMLPGPGGVALDAGSTDGTLFPPVAGIVPDSVAVDLGGTGTR
ncbi:SseB family protein [Streptomyces sp. NPDC048330]|uniref:SseB family protein n=1 Tax=Streptomyces sp. NPDC048330 TaxID=3365533 RepID=UPI003723CFB6